MKTYNFWLLPLCLPAMCSLACIEDPLIGDWNLVKMENDTLPRTFIGEQSGCEYLIRSGDLSISEQFRGGLYLDWQKTCGDLVEQLGSIGITAEKWHPNYKLWYTDNPDFWMDCTLEDDTLTCTDVNDAEWIYERTE